MAEQSRETIETENIDGNEILPDVVASMEMLTVESDVTSAKPSTPRRYPTRKRAKSEKCLAILNRRCSLKPKRRCYSELETDGEIRDYYLDKSIKRKPRTTLETIYEEIDGMSENSNLISARKFKRLIKFSGDDSKSIDSKTKKRRAKIRQVFGSKFKTKSGNVSMQALIKKLNAIRADAMSTAE